MSGHSKWSTIKRQKGATDAKRGQAFTKLARLITMAAKQGGGDPESNSKLREALVAARDVNLPKDNIQRAIDRGLGKLPGQNLEEVVYEGFGPGKTAFYLEGVTDNKLRTNQIVKNLFDRSGGSLGTSGSTAYMFDKKGELKVEGKNGDSDEEQLELIDLGAQDVEEYQEGETKKYLVYVQSSELNTMGNKLTQAGYQVESKEIVFQPNITVDINDLELAKRVINLAEKLEEEDDINQVYTNFNLSDEVAGNLGL